MKEKNKRLYICIIILFFCVTFIIAYSSRISYAAPLENSVRVKENSDLTYYIDIIYDGKDKNLVMSNDSTMAEVHSDYIYIEDKIPDGLTFKGFVTSEDGTIGAVQRDDNTKSCTGYVVDGTSGLVYDEATHTVSFKVKNLKAGCKITVGIITTTPSLPEDQIRMDFYNTAFAKEGTFSASSNTAHAYIGEMEATLYDVIYKYEGDVPDGAPTLPATAQYLGGATISVNNDISLDGYVFSGWSTQDVTITNGDFIMPEKTVTFTGSFIKKETYKVSYKIDGESPEGFIVPTTKEYGENDIVYIDSLTLGDEINGYRFLGWTTTDTTVTDGTFEMPAQSVTFIGRFEKISYTVSYKFQGDVIPPNADSLLPETKSYYPNDEVSIEENPTSEGYRFLGWYYSETFKMPEENVVIYGEWMVEVGTFTPTMATTIVNPKNYYSKDDIIEFKITITNTADFTIKNVIIQNHLSGSTFTQNENYTLLNTQFAQIPSIAANSTIEVYATYIVGDEPLKEYSNIVTLNGALADNNYTLDTSTEYETKNIFNVANISLQINKVDEDNNVLQGAEFSLYSDSNKTNLISTGTTFTKLTPSTTYYLEETKAPSGYILLGKTLVVTVNSNGEISIENYEVANQDGIGIVNILNQKINILPNTGGIGNIPYVISGIIVIFITVVGYIFYLKRKKEKQSNTEQGSDNK